MGVSANRGPVVLSVAGHLVPLPNSFPDDQIPGLEAGLGSAAAAVIVEFGIALTAMATPVAIASTHFISILRSVAAGRTRLQRANRRKLLIHSARRATRPP